jgi:hypothetical protein
MLTKSGIVTFVSQLQSLHSRCKFTSLSVTLPTSSLILTKSRSYDVQQIAASCHLYAYYGTGDLWRIMAPVLSVRDQGVVTDADLVMYTCSTHGLAVFRCFSPVTSDQSFATYDHVPISRDRLDLRQTGLRQLSADRSPDLLCTTT